jgi:hypothetical protein
MHVFNGWSKKARQGGNLNDICLEGRGRNHLLVGQSPFAAARRERIRSLLWRLSNGFAFTATFRRGFTLNAMGTSLGILRLRAAITAATATARILRQSKTVGLYPSIGTTANEMRHAGHDGHCGRQPDDQTQK